MPNLTQAHDEWATRPSDERFWNLAEMLESSDQSRMRSEETEFSFAESEFGSDERGITLEARINGSSATRSRLNNYAFGQLSRTFGAPADYLNKLPARLAAQCLNEGMAEWVSRKGDRTRHGLFTNKPDGVRVLRAATSDRYVRVWNSEIVSRLGELESSGWVVPSARPTDDEDQSRIRIATEADVIDYGSQSDLTVRVGDRIGPAGLYASDHDMFAFMIHPEIEITDGASPHGLRRGTMIRQSEVGDCAIWKLDFLFNTVCGNHIVWGAENVTESRVVHTGNSVNERWGSMIEEMESYTQSSAQEQEQKIVRAMNTKLGQDREEVTELLYQKRWLGKRASTAALDLAERYESVHGDPLSAWGVVQGITRLSQRAKFADKRAKLDGKAGKILAEVIHLN